MGTVPMATHSLSKKSHHFIIQTNGQGSLKLVLHKNLNDQKVVDIISFYSASQISNVLLQVQIIEFGLWNCQVLLLVNPSLIS